MNHISRLKNGKRFYKRFRSATHPGRTDIYPLFGLPLLEIFEAIHRVTLKNNKFLEFLGARGNLDSLH